MEPSTPELYSEAAIKLRENITQFREQIAMDAEKLMFETMPSKVIQLDTLFKTLPEFNVKKFHDIEVALLNSTNSEELPTPVKRRRSSTASNHSGQIDGLITLPKSTQTITTNDHIHRMMTVIKNEVFQLIEMCNTVKIWIQLNIPRIEDGNNFGVSIQEETVAELSRAEDSGFSILESITKYYVTRAKLCSKLIKYPNLGDYHQAVRELDEKEYNNLKLCSNDLRNSYAILYDMIMKNLDKIKKPRSSNTASLY
jgi:proteasome activator subunit 3 (PA28 gamma)